MSVADKAKWDQKYIDKPRLLTPRAASEVLERYAFKGEGLRALDLACGAGRNALYLAEEHYMVDAVDVAAIALEALKADALQRGVRESVNTVLQDLDTFMPKPERYDVIVMSNFLDRGLISRTKSALKVGGRYIVETYMVDDMNEKKDSNTANLLQADELRMLFADGFREVYYDEYKNEDYEIYKMKKQVIVVEKL